MDYSVFFQRAFLIVPLILSLSIHEFSHAWMAAKLGDDTGARLGRLTLNPLSHIDFIGTLLLPLLGIPLGWARPVPVDPTRFRKGVSMKRGMMLTAAAGPVSNVLLAVFCTIGYGVLVRFSPEQAVAESGLAALLVIGIQLNIALALFNALPIPPLDGSRIVEGVLPLRLRGVWEQFARMSPLLMFGVIFFAGTLLRAPSALAHGLLNRLLLAIAT